MCSPKKSLDQAVLFNCIQYSFSIIDLYNTEMALSQKASLRFSSND